MQRLRHLAQDDRPMGRRHIVIIPSAGENNSDEKQYYQLLELQNNIISQLNSVDDHKTLG